MRKRLIAADGAIVRLHQSALHNVMELASRMQVVVWRNNAMEHVEMTFLMSTARICLALVRSCMSQFVVKMDGHTPVAALPLAVA
jgi:hypothetical protein